MNKKTIIIIVIIVVIILLAIFIYSLTKKKMSKGGKNNPGNIITSHIKWGGEITQPGDVFESFRSVGDGVRAMYQNLLAYKQLHGLDTIRGIITRWAPPGNVGYAKTIGKPNDTLGYIKFVCEKTGIDADKKLIFSDYPAIISAISKQEGNTIVSTNEAQAYINNLA